MFVATARTAHRAAADNTAACGTTGARPVSDEQAAALKQCFLCGPAPAEPTAEVRIGAHIAAYVRDHVLDPEGHADLIAAIDAAPRHRIGSGAAAALVLTADQRRQLHTALSNLEAGMLLGAYTGTGFPRHRVAVMAARAAA